MTATGVVTPGRHKGVNSVTHPDTATDHVYCFDLTFTPVVAVASSFALNAAFTSTGVRR